MIDKFMHGFLNRVYGYDDYTQLEINSKLIQKIDEVIDNCNNAFEFVDWLKEQGVPDEVQTIIDTMLEDGTLENLININKLEEIRTELYETVKKGQGTLDDFNEETRRVILGLEEGQINAVLGEKNVTKKNIKDNEVCFNHLNSQSNLINPLTVIYNKIITQFILDYL